MTWMNATEQSVEALFHEQTYPHDRGSQPGRKRSAFTIAIARQAGAQGAEIARILGEKLNWPVFDRELLQRIADQAGVRVRLLEGLDERRVGWLREVMESFAAKPTFHTAFYLRHLVETIASLGAHGEAIIVGRGAGMILPAATTLRVRVVAQMEDRVASAMRNQNLTRQAAQRWVESADRERWQFYKEHFHKDVSDPLNHDLTLNSSRFSPAECADIIVAALKVAQAREPGW